MININTPLFWLTSDVDWASDYAIQEFLQFAAGNGITPTVFATHSTLTLNQGAELGIHPNFLPGSTHGTDTRSVIEHMLGAFPQAKAFRSHHFVDSSDVAAEMFWRGIKYDSNLCLHMQDDIVPLRTSADRSVSRFSGKTTCAGLLIPATGRSKNTSIASPRRG